MCLLAQIDLEELHASNRQVGTPNPWPNSGGLLFFVAIAADGEIVEDEDFNPIATQTLWVAKLAESPLAAPSGRVSIPPTRIQLLPDHNSVPQVDAAIVEAALLSDEELDVYREFLESHLAESEAQDPSAADMNGDQQFGGYPSPVQSNALEAQAEYIRSEDYPGEDRNGWLRAAQWRLLLQLGSDDVFMWGTDMGRLYFMIHEDDLLRRDFSRVVAFAAGH